MILILLSIFSYNVFSVTATDHFMMQDYCQCQYDISDDLKLTPKVPQFKNCVVKLLGALSRDRMKSRALERSRTLRENDPVICSEQDKSNWIKLYLEKQSAYYETLKDQIEKQLCSNITQEVPQNRKELCRDKLFYLTQNYQKSVYEKCSSDLLGESNDISTCVKTNIYKYLLGITTSDYFGEFCGIPKGAQNYDELRLSCDKTVKAKLKDTFYAKEISFCFDTSNFMTIQETGIETCQNFFIDKTLGFATKKEMEVLVSCIKSASAGSSVEECINDHYRSLDTHGYLQELENKYCNKDLFLMERDRRRCMTDLLVNNFSNIETYPICAEKANQIDDPKEKDIVFNKCQRERHLEKLKKDRTFEISDCSDREKYGGDNFIEKQRECLERAAQFNDRLANCESLEGQEQLKSCLEGMDPELKPNLEKHLLTKSAKFESIDPKQCRKSGMLDHGCLIDLVYQNELGIHPQETDINNCYANPNQSECEQIVQESMEKIDNGGETPQSTRPRGSSGGTPNPVSNSALQLLGSNSDSNQVPDINTSAGSITRSSDAPADIRAGNGNSTPQIPNIESDDASHMMRAMSYSTIRSKEPECRSLFKAGVTVGVTRIGSIFMMNTCKDDNEQLMSSADDVQEQSRVSSLNLNQCATKSAQMDEAGNVIAGNFTATGQQIASQRAATEGRVVPCSTNTQAFYDFDSRDDLKRVVINNINNSHSIEEIEKNLLEGIDTLLASGESIDYEEEMFSEKLFLDEEQFKFLSILYITVMHEMILNRAYAQDDRNDPSISSSFTSALSTDNQSQYSKAVKKFGKSHGTPAIDHLISFGNSTQSAMHQANARQLRFENERKGMEAVYNKLESGK